jgi:hypothetical protein
MKNTDTLLGSSKEAGLHVNAENMKHMFLSCYQTRGQKCYMNKVNKSSKNITKFTCLGMMVTNTKLHS